MLDEFIQKKRPNLGFILQQIAEVNENEDKYYADLQLGGFDLSKPGDVRLLHYAMKRYKLHMEEILANEGLTLENYYAFLESRMSLAWIRKNSVYQIRYEFH